MNNRIAFVPVIDLGIFRPVYLNTAYKLQTAGEVDSVYAGNISDFIGFINKYPRNEELSIIAVAPFWHHDDIASDLHDCGNLEIELQFCNTYFMRTIIGAFMGEKDCILCCRNVEIA